MDRIDQLERQLVELNRRFHLLTLAVSEDQAHPGCIDEILPLVAGPLDVRVTVLASAVEEWISQYCSSVYCVVGLDMEWRPNRKGEDNKLATLQIATDAACLIVQLLYMDAIPDALKYLLFDNRVIKVGVGIEEDCKKLSRHYGLVCHGLTDLRSIADSFHHSCHCFPDLGTAGLARLGSEILSIDCSKDKRVTLADWAALELSRDQIIYAANDAHIAYLVYGQLSQQFPQCACGRISCLVYDRLSKRFLPCPRCGRGYTSSPPKNVVRRIDTRRLYF